MITGLANLKNTRPAIDPAAPQDRSIPPDSKIPEWPKAIYQEIKSTLLNPNFPCVFAREAMKRDAIRFCWLTSPAGDACRAQAAATIKSYLDDCASIPPLESLLETQLIVFEPIERPLSLDEYHAQAWGFLQSLHEHDSQPWPAEIPTDPADPMWSFCFAGVPLFINVSAPAHRTRRCRNLCRSLTLVMQPRANFDIVAGKDHPNGEAIREQIRQRMDAFDDVPSPTELGTYGDQSNREWHQYVLKETNAPPTDACPLKIRPRTGGRP